MNITTKMRIKNREYENRVYFHKPRIIETANTEYREHGEIPVQSESTSNRRFATSYNGVLIVEITGRKGQLGLCILESPYALGSEVSVCVIS